MRKIYLLSFLFCAAAGLKAGAQTHGSKQASWGTQIGTTWYDLQTNGSMGNRIIRHPNGALTATWVESCDNQTGFPNRGAGFNHFNGTTWTEGTDGTCPKAFGAFSNRVGYPDIATLPGGGELIMAHSPLQKVQRAALGSAATAPFNASQQLNASVVDPRLNWPRVVSSGNTLHLVAAMNPGFFSNPAWMKLAYYHSTDGGQTFSETLLPGYDSLSYPSGTSGEDYAVHARGPVVAIVTGSINSDWTLWKSTDSGQTFTRSVIRSFNPVDTIMTASGDTLCPSNDNTHAVLIDHNGAVHCWVGRMMASVNSTVTGVDGYYPAWSHALLYWTDNGSTPSGPVEIVSDLESIPGATVMGLTSMYLGALISMPTAGISPNGDLYVVYSAIVPGTFYAPDSTAFRDLYVIRGTQGGAVWSAPRNIAGQIAGVGNTNMEEDVYPSVVHDIGPDSLLHLVWQSDDVPGSFVRDGRPSASASQIMYYGIPVSGGTNAWPLAAGQPKESTSFQVKAVPNPTSSHTVLQISLNEASNVAIKVTDLLGRFVQQLPVEQFEPGLHSVNLDLEQQPAGVYFCTATSDNSQRTIRIVKQ